MHILLEAGANVFTLSHGWNPSLSDAHKKSKLRYKAWVKAGRPRHVDNQSRTAYKQAKSEFCRLLRQTELEQRDRFFSDLDFASWDSKRFNLIRHVNNLSQKKLLVNDVQYKGSSKVWADSFGPLATPPERSSSAFELSIEEEYNSIFASTRVMSCNFVSYDEVSEMISSLEHNKAAGNDDVDPEHIILGGFSLPGISVFCPMHCCQLQTSPWLS